MKKCLTLGDHVRVKADLIPVADMSRKEINEASYFILQRSLSVQCHSYWLDVVQPVDGVLTLLIEGGASLFFQDSSVYSGITRGVREYNP